MKRRELEHVLRAASRIADETDVLAILDAISHPQLRH